MALAVACPECGELQRVDADPLGSATRCRKCGHIFFFAQIAHSQTSASTLGQEAASQVETSESTMLAVSPLEAGSAKDPPLPSRIGSYLVRQRLGDGIMGELFRAFDPDLNRDVVIQTLRPEHARAPQRKQTFLHEARAAAKLHHLNVVAVHQICTEGENPYLVMEFVDGQSLERLFSPQQPLSWRTATRAIQDAAAGLAVAHGIGLVHGQLQPSSLIRSRNGVTKVLGLGLARAAATIARFSGQSRPPPPDFSAPEVRLGQEPDLRSDLYSLACTYYCLLTGQSPYSPTPIGSSDDPHRDPPVPDPRRAVPTLPKSVGRIVLRGTQQDPRDRYQTAADLIADLEAVLAMPDHVPEVAATEPAPARATDQDDAQQEHVIKASPVDPAFRRKPDGRRSSLSPRTWGAVGGGVLVVVLLGLIFAINHEREAGRTGVPAAVAGGAGKTEVVSEASPAPATAQSLATPSSATGEGTAAPPPPLVAPFDADQAKQRQQAWARSLGIQVESRNSMGMTMVLIPPGEYVMGAVRPESALAQAGPRYPIRIRQPFLMSKHEVTVGQFRAFATAQSYQSEVLRNGLGTMGFGASSAQWPRGPQFHWQQLGFAQADDHPVAGVGWNDAVAFCRWLQEKEGRSYRLPTEAEWEYACRAGAIDVPQVTDAELVQLGNFADAALKRAFPFQKNALDADDGYPQTAPVGSFPPNPFGLCDMLGNVAERCMDVYVPGSDPSRPGAGGDKAVRGSPWNEPPRINLGWRIPPGMGVCTVGFRVVQELPLADHPRQAGNNGSSGIGR